MDPRERVRAWRLGESAINDMQFAGAEFQGTDPLSVDCRDPRIFDT
jgi:hypothetical protein